MKISRTDDEISALIDEVIKTPIDPAIRFSILSVFSYLLADNLEKSTDTPTAQWKAQLRLSSKLQKGSQLEALQFAFVNTFKTLVARDKDIPDFLNEHEQFDLLLKRPNDLLAKNKKLLDDLSKVAVYFMKANDMEELNLSNKAISKLHNAEWVVHTPRNAEEGIRFTIKQN